jgi:hypothetical protein
MSERKHRRFQHLAWLTVHLCVMLVVAAGASERSRAADISGQRQAVVKERGAAVMPFDLDLTTHTFDDTTDGGIQTVTANNPHGSEKGISASLHRSTARRCQASLRSRPMPAGCPCPIGLSMQAQA